MDGDPAPRERRAHHPGRGPSRGGGPREPGAGTGPRAAPPPRTASARDSPPEPPNSPPEPRQPPRATQRPPGPREPSRAPESPPEPQAAPVSPSPSDVSRARQSPPEPGSQPQGPPEPPERPQRSLGPSLRPRVTRKFEEPRLQSPVQINLPRVSTRVLASLIQSYRGPEAFLIVRQGPRASDASGTSRPALSSSSCFLDQFDCPCLVHIEQRPQDDKTDNNSKWQKKHLKLRSQWGTSPSYQPWTQPNGNRPKPRLTNVPPNPRFVDCINLAWAARPKSQRSLPWFCNYTQCPTRTPWGPTIKTLATSSRVYDFGRDCSVSASEAMLLQGYPIDALDLTMFKKQGALFRAVGEGMTCPCIGSLVLSVYLNPMAPWWRRAVLRSSSAAAP